MSEERVVFLGGHRKCGTTMFLNLFDGHPECCVFPTDISVLYAYFPVYTDGEHSAEERLKRLDVVIFGTLQRLRERQGLDERLPVEAMREHFFAHVDRDRLADIGTVIRQLVASYRVAIDRPVEAAPVVVLKETSLEIFAGMLADLFPGARFIQLLRDPRDNLGALRAGVDKHYSLFGETEAHILASLLHRVGLSHALAEPNRAHLGADRFATPRFEDLVKDPGAQMREVAAFAGIEFTPQLCSPSVMSVPTAGNNYDDEKFFQVSARNVGRWRERITDFEAQVIEFHLGQHMEQFGYRCEFAPADRARAASEFYKWSNYAYFFKDSFAVT